MVRPEAWLEEAEAVVVVASFIRSTRTSCGTGIVGRSTCGCTAVTVLRFRRAAEEVAGVGILQRLTIALDSNEHDPLVVLCVWGVWCVGSAGLGVGSLVGVVCAADGFGQRRLRRARALA